jgi:hypothetical protein
MSEQKDEEKVSELVKLKAMEADVKLMCEALDKRESEFNKSIAAHDKAIVTFNKKVKLVSASDSFNRMVVLVDEIYTMYVAQHGDAGGLYDSIKLLLDSRSRYSAQPAKK